MLAASIAELAVGIMTTSIAVFALVEHLRRGRSKSRLLLWFGLFAGMYGVRTLGRSRAIQLLFDAPEVFWTYFSALLDYTILIPAFLFWEEIYGRGWKDSIRWLVWGVAVYGAVALMAMAVLRRPYVIIEPGGLALVAGMILAVGNYLMGYRPPALTEARTFLMGVGVFLVFVLNSHMGPWSVRINNADPEPFGFFFFLCCLGWVAAHRIRSNEQQLLSLEEELKAARRIQQSILPHSIPQEPGLQVAVQYAPMTAVAGDFYDFLRADGQYLGVLVADVAGHGVPAALGASMVKVAVSTQLPMRAIRRG